MSEAEPGIVFDDDGMPEKRLMYESDVIDYFCDERGNVEAVTLVERWGKSGRRRARCRDLIPGNCALPPSNGGYGCNTHGAIIVDDTVLEVKEMTDKSQWWVNHVEWGINDDV